MKRFFAFITSLPFMAFLFLLLAVSMAAATFIESRYGTPAARSLVFNSLWFELAWFLFAVNLINNLFKYRLLKGKKLTLGIFHIAFLLILLGAAVTRFFSYEGVMHIREGASSDSILSSEDYFYASVNGQVKTHRAVFSEATPSRFSESFSLNSKKIKIKTVGFIRNAEKKAVPAETGNPVVDFVVSVPGGGGMQSYSFLKGNKMSFPGFSAAFGADPEVLVNFFNTGENLYMTCRSKASGSTMSGEDAVEINPGDTVSVQKMFLYRLGNFSFLVRDFVEKAGFMAVKSRMGETGTDAVIVSISDGNREKKVPVFGTSGSVGDTVKLEIDEQLLQLAWGSRTLKVPFRIRLNDFQLEKYPGSESPSSYASEVTLSDEGKGLEKNVRIFMNNTLYYKGFKFFQSSYDRDELGTVLSVNHDFWGTWITYAGYLLLVIGIVLSLLNRDSYFNHLVRRLKAIGAAKTLLIILLAGIGATATAQSGTSASLPDIDQRIIREFGNLLVQGHDGRIEPVSTLTSEILRKVSRKSAIFGKSPDEVFLSMMTFPQVWKSLPVVKVANKTLAGELGASGGYLAPESFFDEKGNYRIADKVNAAYEKAPALRNRVEKEYIYVDERINICMMIFEGSMLNIFPGKNRETKWYTPGSAAPEYAGGDSLFVSSGFRLLAESIAEGKTNEALQVLSAAAGFQEKYGGNLIPSVTSRKIEILYNKINPFKRVFPFYLLFGLLLLFILFLNILRQKQIPRIVRKAFFGIIFAGFIVHTIGLIVRWYISGHAPWSNGYESIVYVAWAAMLAGLIFGRKYPMVVGTAAFLSGIALFVAHLSWMNPEVTNLVPVLKSYWLTIHVAVITGSYGFIGLSAFLGILVLILIALRNRNNSGKTTTIIDQLTTINEMSAMAGLYSPTNGTFLGAVWANESWGRYWGWDPKETWSLITVLIYSFIVHMRMIPSLKGIYNFNMASVLGFTSVLMTYFGVNYYLTGLHSYGSGVTNGIHWAIPVCFILLAALMIYSWKKYRKFEKEFIKN
jgi:cytochrome c-type biogenesis protein CcsB